VKRERGSVKFDYELRRYGQPRAGCQFRDKIRRGVVGDLFGLKSDESELNGPHESSR